ncbi:unnamed protein product [Acanthoscelides obtectus]|nr:unnamed protein product [Acanthoscelides obtectus]CAK1622996.1 Zinc finger protein 808 [Acanthoscelides obtectus]
MSIQIKEEPLENDENSSSNIHIKSEPEDLDDSMNGEYNEFPPALSPQMPEHEHMETGIQNGGSSTNLYVNDNDKRCRYCDKLFSNISNRKKHEKAIHPPNEPYARRSMCEISPKKSQQNGEQIQPSGTSEESEDQTGSQTDQLAEQHQFTEYNEQLTQEASTTQPEEGLPETMSIENAEEELTETENTDEPVESSEPKDEANQQKILFAAGLKLLESNTTPISCEMLSKIELSYAEKCKAMVKMHRTLECACHNVNHPNLKGLLSHLRSLRIWFPVFTCYNCMITFTDRSTFTRHNVKCPSASLDTLTKLSNLRKRSEVKVRLYQNFKCTSCKFMFSFHEDFMKHVDEEHCDVVLPVQCSCEREFDNLEDYKDHVYLSCLVEFYCDICFITTDSVEEFQKHAEEAHDESEGFILKQDDGYAMRKAMMQSPPKPKETVDENAIVTGKRERRPPKPIDIIMPTPNRSATPKEKDEPYVSVYNHPYSITPRSGTKACPICNKEYSSYHNMMRHFKTHSEEEIRKYENESVYACPDCEEMFRLPEWRQHLMAKHQPTACEECGRMFQFRTELDQHRSVHLNIKVYRDSKTHSLKTAMISPGSEQVMLLCEICEEIFHSREELKQHKLGHFQNLQNGGMIKKEPVDVDDQRTWTCTPCDKTYHTYSGLWDHNRRKHTGEEKSIASTEYPKQCKYCEKVLLSGAAYARHKMIHEKDRIPTDANARMVMYTQQNRKSATPPMQPQEEYHTCPHCSKVFGSKSNLKNHMKTHQQGYTCGVCKDVFGTTEELLQHNMIEHPGDAMSLLETEIKQEPDEEMVMQRQPYIVYTCDVCVATFESKHALMRHKEMHAQEMAQQPATSKSVFCKYCKIQFDSVISLAKHMHLEHGESSKPKQMKIKEANPGRKFTCSICNKSFHTQNALSTHIGWHRRGTNDSNTKVSKVIQQVARDIPRAVPLPQMRVQNAPSFRCHTCSGEFPNNTALQVHILEKHRSSNSISLVPRCNPCDKDFKSHEEYEKHKRFHDFLERQKQAEQQQQQAMMQQQQEQMASVHNTSGKNFPCKYCNAGFSRSDTLGIHMRQHHKEYVPTEFKCNYCERIFDKQNSLSIHLKTHEKQRLANVPSKPVFSCSICNMGFEMPKELRAHTISAHPF